MVTQIGYTPYVSPYKNGDNIKINSSLNNFDIEDEAIISSHAKLLNEIEKFNNGQSSELDLILSSNSNNIQTEAILKVIRTKNELLDKFINT